MAVRAKSVEDLRPEDIPEADVVATPVPANDAPPSPWNPDMTAAPRDGRIILVTESLNAPDGVRALWYKALGQGRPWAKPPEGWLDPRGRQWIKFQPVGWALS